jgi:hypothetical protein
LQYSDLFRTMLDGCSMVPDWGPMVPDGGPMVPDSAPDGVDGRKINDRTHRAPIGHRQASIGHWSAKLAKCRVSVHRLHLTLGARWVRSFIFLHRAPSPILRPSIGHFSEGSGLVF